MNKDDVKKIDEITAEEAAAAAQEATEELSSEDLEKVNGGKVRFKPKTWWDKIKAQNNSETGDGR